jgi:hypothetical protein
LTLGRFAHASLTADAQQAATGLIVQLVGRLGRGADPAQRASVATSRALIDRLLALPTPRSVASGGQLTAPPAGQFGGSGTVTAGVGKAGSGTASESVAIDGCPDADGLDHGTVRFGVEQHLKSPLPLGAEFRIDVSIAVSAKLVAHVSSGAQLVDYDADIHLRGTASGGIYLAGRPVLTANPGPTDYHIVLVGIVPGAPAANLWNSAHIGQTSVTGPGAALETIDARGDIESPETSAAYSLAVIGVTGRADRPLEDAQYNWDKAAACLQATFDPSSLSGVSPDSTSDVSVTESGVSRDPTSDVSVTVKSTVDGTGVSVPLDVTASGGASVVPTHLTPNPSAKLSVTADRQPNQTDSVFADGTSKRGRARGTLTVSTLGQLTVRFSVSSNGGGSGTYDDSSGPVVNRGNYSEQRSLSLTTVVTLSEPADPGQAVSGQGPLSWGAPRGRRTTTTPTRAWARRCARSTSTARSPPRRTARSRSSRSRSPPP